jgi:hypothetical protein
VAIFFVFEGLQDEEVSNGCFEGVEAESLFKKVLWWREIGE